MLKVYFQIIFLNLLICISTQAQNLNLEKIQKINTQLEENTFLDNSILSKINNECIEKTENTKQDISFKEYLNITENILSQGMPKNIKQTIRELAYTNLDLDSLNKENLSYWSLPLPNTFGSTWINIDLDLVKKLNKDFPIILEKFYKEKLIDDIKYQEIKQKSKEITFLMPFHSFELIYKFID